MKPQAIVAHERRIIRRLEARGESGLGDALVRLDGAVVGRRFRIESLYAVGSEGAVYLARDIEDSGAPMRVAKVALLPLHRPFDLTDEELQRRRESLREEATNLARSDTRYMPASCGLFHFQNPALEADWGGEFAEPEPCLVMEKIPGFDLDLWLARMHSSRVPKVLLRRQLDHVAVVVLSALMELQDHGFFYTDLRPGNVRIRGRSKERVRLLDAGSLVRVDDLSGKFPHVPAYLPPELFESSHGGGLLLPTPAVQAVMAGRTLFEVATGRVPVPGEPVETAALYGLTVSPSVAETVERLCRGSFPDVATALAYLSENFRHEASERAAPAVAPSRSRATAPAREAPQSAVPEPRVPEAPPVTFSLPPAKPRLDLHSMLASARSVPAPARSPARPADRPASLVAVRAVEQRNEPAPAAARPAAERPAAERPAAERPVAPAPAPRVAPASSVPSPASSVRPVPPPVRPAKQAPAVKRVDDPLDFEFAEKYGAAVARGEAPPPVTPAKRAAPAIPDSLPASPPTGPHVTHISVLEPITSEAIDDVPVRPAAAAPAAATPVQSPPMQSPPRPVARPAQAPVAKPPASTAVPLAQAFTLTPAPPRPPRSARETQTEFHEPPPRPSDAAPSRPAPARAASPATMSQVGPDGPVATPAARAADATGDADPDSEAILPASSPVKSFFARLLDLLRGRR